MEQKKTNQERGRKRLRGRTKAIVGSQPSQAPGQDQDIHALLDSHGLERRVTHADGNSPAQGISNRPAKEEHAFPPVETQEPEPAAPDPAIPQQQGGNRGNV